MTKEQLLTIIQGGHLTDGDLADAILAELVAVAVECDSLEYAFKPGHECAESIRSLKA